MHVEILAAIISAIVAFLVSVLFRYLDRERPRWIIDVSEAATPFHDGSSFSVEVTAKNAGNGSAYDAMIVTPIRTAVSRHASSVVQPGEELHALVPVRLESEPELDEMGSPIPVPLAVEHLAGVRVQIRWTRPPVFWIPRSRRYSLASSLKRQRRFLDDA